MLKYKEKWVRPATCYYWHWQFTSSFAILLSCDEVTNIRGFQVSEKWKKSPCLLRCGCSGVVVGKVTAVPGAGPCCCCAAVWRLLRAVVFRHRAPSHLHHSRDTRDVRPSWRHQTLCSLTVLCRSPHTLAILNRIWWYTIQSTVCEANFIMSTLSLCQSVSVLSWSCQLWQ